MSSRALASSGADSALGISGGSSHAESAKLRQAPRRDSAMAAASCVRAASSGVAKVPSQSLDPRPPGTRTSHTHRPAWPRRRTPRYTGCRVSRNLVRPAGFLGGADHTVLYSTCSADDVGDGEGVSIADSLKVSSLVVVCVVALAVVELGSMEQWSSDLDGGSGRRPGKYI